MIILWLQCILTHLSSLTWCTPARISLHVIEFVEAYLYFVTPTEDTTIQGAKGEWHAYQRLINGLSSEQVQCYDKPHTPQSHDENVSEMISRFALRLMRRLHNNGFYEDEHASVDVHIPSAR